MSAFTAFAPSEPPKQKMCRTRRRRGRAGREELLPQGPTDRIPRHLHPRRLEEAPSLVEGEKDGAHEAAEDLVREAYVPGGYP
jgi:hypothetical protein